jgi:hypothetical protein
MGPFLDNRAHAKFLSHKAGCPMLKDAISATEKRRHVCTCEFSQEDQIRELERRFPVTLPIVMKIYNFKSQGFQKLPTFISIEEYR